MATSPEMIKELASLAHNQRSFLRIWERARQWLAIAQRSQEITDVKRCGELFRLAFQSRVGQNVSFLTSFGEALLFEGKFFGNPIFAREGLDILQQGVADGDGEAWVPYALGHKLLYELTGDRALFERADALFREALVAVPHQWRLWLDWGSLFLESAWRRRSLPEVESALEKFTSLKMDECDPAEVAAPLGEGLALLGFLIDDVRLIRDGKTKIAKWLPHVHRDNSKVLVAGGMVFLIEGLYFQDVHFFEEAHTLFLRALEYNSHDIRAQDALFQLHLAWGGITEESGEMVHACNAIERVVQLRPSSALHMMEWGATLVQLSQLQESEVEQQALCEEAIDKLRKAVEMGSEVYPNNLKDCHSGSTKGRSLIDRKGAHIRNMRPFTIDQPRELTRQSKPSSSDCSGIEARYHLGLALDLLGDLTGALEYFEEAVDQLMSVYAQFPFDRHVVFRYGLALCRLGEIAGRDVLVQEAEKLFLQLLQRDDEDEELHCQMGYAQLLLAQQADKKAAYWECAEKHLLRAAALGSIESNYHLACLYSMMERNGRALEFLKRADRAGVLPSNEELMEDHWLEHVCRSEGFARFMEERDG